MQDNKNESSAANLKLCLLILTCIAEDQYANSMMHDSNLTYKVLLHRAQMRHRKLPQVYTLSLTYCIEIYVVLLHSIQWNKISIDHVRPSFSSSKCIFNFLISFNFQGADNKIATISCHSIRLISRIYCFTFNEEISDGVILTVDWCGASDSVLSEALSSPFDLSMERTLGRLDKSFKVFSQSRTEFNKTV